MKKYNYYEVVENDIKENWKECLEDKDNIVDENDLYYKLLFRLPDINEITGITNEYDISDIDVENAVKGNIDLLKEMRENDFINDSELSILKLDYRHLDYKIRCYVVSKVVDNIIDDLWDEYEKEMK